ncbi:MAG: NAD-binding protein [Actinobacteria bacterium]|nr:NAD-binding protein [Actinomycetota bacterium]
MSSPAPVRRVASQGPSTTAIFLVLRRMRLPLIVLISLFAISVLGLTLVPGQDVDGQPWRMDLFDAFYFMSYTATTIGFGEIPYPFSTAQRAWVIVTIYLSVVAWAYAIGSVLALLQDRGFKEALGLQRFERQVRRMREPFVILAGFGQAGEVVARSLDRRDHRVVVLDVEPGRIEALDLAAFHSDVPGLPADASNPHELRRAGLMSKYCSGVIALTNDDEANLAITMSAALMRPDVPVVCRTMEDVLIERIRAFGSPIIIDPFNLFGDELLVALRAPHAYQLTSWLTSNPGDPLPKAMAIPQHGRWVVCGYGRFGGHLTADLVRSGIPVTVIDERAEALDGVEVITGDATDPQVLQRADLGSAVAFAAATNNDITNLSLLVSAKKANPRLFTIARQNDPANTPLFDGLPIDSTLLPTTLIAHEVLARIGDPLLWAFVQQAQQHTDDWGVALVERITGRCGSERPDIWTLALTPAGAPALIPHLEQATVGGLLHDPQDRTRELDAVVLLLKRGDQILMTPADDEPLRADDELLLVGMSYDRRALDTTVSVPTAAEYVLTGDRVGQSWIWRTLVDR